MIDPNKNRLNFADCLKPTEGFKLDLAIGTSYNLDLEALLFIPISLFNAQDLKRTDGLTDQLLKSLEEVPKKVMLFYQSDKLKNPPKYNPLLSYWEKSLYPVTMPDFKSSFHPKIWLLRYVAHENPEIVDYKFICTSRNLTLSRDWDMAITLRAQVSHKRNEKQNRTLLNFFKYLEKNSEAEIPDFIEEEILRLDFSEDLEGRELSFYPILEGKGHPHKSMESAIDTMLVMSPFLDKSSVEYYRKKAPTVYIFSSEYELCTKLSDTPLRGSEYMFNPKLEETYEQDTESLESAIETDAIVPEEEVTIADFSPSTNLHAKVYITQKSNSVTWYLGSANCTSSARMHNVEFLTAITDLDGTLENVDRVHEILTHVGKSNESIFSEFDNSYCSGEELEDSEPDFRQITYLLSAMLISGVCAPLSNGHYDVVLEFSEVSEAIDETYDIKCALLSHQKLQMPWTNKVSKLTFRNVNLASLTPFIVFHVTKEDAQTSFVYKMEIDIPDERMSAILARIFEDKEKLLRYLVCLLEGNTKVTNVLGPLYEVAEDDPSKNITRINYNQINLPLYEELLRASSRDPEAIEHACKMVQRLKKYQDAHPDQENIVDESLLELIQTFKNIIIDGSK